MAQKVWRLWVGILTCSSPCCLCGMRTRFVVWYTICSRSTHCPHHKGFCYGARRRSTIQRLPTGKVAPDREGWHLTARVVPEPTIEPLCIAGHRDHCCNNHSRPTSPLYLPETASGEEIMGKKFGELWHCAMKDGFGFELTYESKHLMCLHFVGYTNHRAPAFPVCVLGK